MTSPSLLINAQRLVVDTIWMTSEELGNLVIEAFSDLKARRYEKLGTISFIDGFTKGMLRRAHIPTPVRRRILSVGRCGQCGSPENLSVDHIVPLSKNGDDSEANFQCLCMNCNRRKGAK